MFLKIAYKRIRATGEEEKTYRLVESYRYMDRVRHEIILHLGKLEELETPEQKRDMAIRINTLMRQYHRKEVDLFKHEDPQVEILAQKFFKEILEKQRVDTASGKSRLVIDEHSVKNKDVREVGTEWLCKQALDQLGLCSFLQHQGWEEEKIQLAYTHIISRCAYPASELRTSEWIRQNSSICEVTGYPISKVTKDKLYHITKELYNIKDALEKHLSYRTSELFDLEDEIILYDLTNTYYEGAMRSSQLAKFGRSKEKRSDAKLVVLALVVNLEGFVKYSQIFEGNMADSTSLQKLIEDLSLRTSSAQRKPTIVMDAGIATQKNLELLKSKKFEYMCVARSSLNKYTIDTDSDPVKIADKKGQPLTLQKVKVEGNTDTWLLVHSEAKAVKESGMNSRFSQRYEQGLENIRASLTKKSGVKKQEKVSERIGRLKAKYPSMNRYYDIQLAIDENGIVTELTWQQKPVEKKEGHYLLRTTLDEKQEATQWAVYNAIRNIEGSFRCLKNDLDLRPIFHKTDEASMAHLHLGILAYWTVNTLRYQLKAKGIQNEWTDIRRIMNTQKLVTTTMVDQYDQLITIRQCSEPEAKVMEIYTALNYKLQPFTRKKSVVPLSENQKIETPATRAKRSG